LPWPYDLPIGADAVERALAARLADPRAMVELNPDEDDAPEAETTRRHFAKVRITPRDKFRRPAGRPSKPKLADEIAGEPIDA
jgi:hypothetical protein